MTKLLTVHQVAQRWGKSSYTIRRYTRDGRLQFAARDHPGDKAPYYFSFEEIQRFEREHRLLIHDETIGQS